MTWLFILRTVRPSQKISLARTKNTLALNGKKLRLSLRRSAIGLKRTPERFSREDMAALWHGALRRRKLLYLKTEMRRSGCSKMARLLSEKPFSEVAQIMGHVTGLECSGCPQRA